MQREVLIDRVHYVSELGVHCVPVYVFSGVSGCSHSTCSRRDFVLNSSGGGLCKSILPLKHSLPILAEVLPLCDK